MAETFFANSQSDATYIDIQLDFNIQIVVDLLASYDEIAKPMMNPSLHSVAACCVPRLPQQTHRFFTGKIPTLVPTILIACHHLRSKVGKCCLSLVPTILIAILIIYCKVGKCWATKTITYYYTAKS